MPRTTREQIQKNLLSHVAYFGVKKIRFSEIAKDAAVSICTLYYYYPGKEEALIVSLDAAGQVYLSALEKILWKKSIPLQTKLEAVITLRV